MEPTVFISHLFEQVREALPEGETYYLVGGAVRDALLGKTAHDLDYVLAGDPRWVAKRVANRLGGAYYLLDDERHTGRVVLSNGENPPETIDFSTFRGPDLESDLRGRDFTLNAMALAVGQEDRLIDPLGGAEDLHKKRLRQCSLQAVTDDPLRILRGVRLAVSLGLSIDRETLEAMRGGLPGLERISAERKRDEIFRMLEGPRPGTALRLLDQIGAIPWTLPELVAQVGVTQSPPHVSDVWRHTLATVDNLDLILRTLEPGAASEKPENLAMGLLVLELGRFRNQIWDQLRSPVTSHRTLRGLLFLAALYHDVAKPETWQVDAAGRIRNFEHELIGAETAEERAQALQLSGLEAARLKTIVRNHMRIHLLVQTGKPPTRRAIYRFFRDTGPAGVDVCLLTLADTLATYGLTIPTEEWTAHLQACRILMESWWERPGEHVRPQVFLNGDDLQALFQLSPGPQIGRLLEALREAGATGQVTDHDQAEAFAREWLEENSR